MEAGLTPAPFEPAEELARRIVNHERATTDASGDGTAKRADEKLRPYLTKFVGAAGYTALLSRAVSLAKADLASMDSVLVNSDGTLSGFDESRSQNADTSPSGELALLTRLLGLLFAFVGEAITLQIVRDVWSEASLEDLSVSLEDTK